MVNDPTTRRWRQIDLANASFGHGVGTTLMQLAVAYSAIVNGGVLVRPRIVESVDGVPIPITVRGTATTPEVSAQMIKMTGQVTKSVPLYARLTR
ncbi:MAG: penicillin-binding transpeptidase domain-containing protein, partial [Burkholderiaceae bacterium]